MMQRSSDSRLVPLRAVLLWALLLGGGGVFAPRAFAQEGEVSGATGGDFEILETGHGGGLVDVAFWEDGLHGVAAGSSGVCVTDDGGHTWNQVRESPKRPGQYYKVGISGPEDLWVAEGRHAHHGVHIWHSTDAGLTWEDASARFPDAPKAVVSDLVVSGTNLCLLAGDHWSFSFVSDDGGRNWRRVGALPGMASHNILSLAKSDGQTLCVMGWIKQSQQMILAVTRAWGPPWENIDLPAEFSETKRPWALAMDFVSPDTGMVARDGGVIFRTEDGGMNWEARHLPAGAADSMPTDLWINPENPQHVLVSVRWNLAPGVTASLPTLFESFYGGVTWQTALEGIMSVEAIFGLDGNRIWVVGDQPGNPGSDLVGMLKETP
jgi:photosystem II stability/assembly factor-like uncharacterized protein